MRRLANFIGGEFVAPAGGKYFEDINPATEECIAEVPDSDATDIDRAVALASADGGVYYVLGYYPDKKRFDGEFRKIKVTTSRPGVHLRHLLPGRRAGGMD